MSRTLDHALGRCRRSGRALIEVRAACHLKSAPHSDGCGYFRGRYCYLQIDCRVVKAMPLCWTSIIDHYTGEVLYSEPCKSTPDALSYGPDFFTGTDRRGEARHRPPP